MLHLKGQTDDVPKIQYQGWFIFTHSTIPIGIYAKLQPTDGFTCTSYMCRMHGLLSKSQQNLLWSKQHLGSRPSRRALQQKMLLAT